MRLHREEWSGAMLMVADAGGALRANGDAAAPANAAGAAEALVVDGKSGAGAVLAKEKEKAGLAAAAVVAVEAIADDEADATVGCSIRQETRSSFCLHATRSGNRSKKNERNTLADTLAVSRQDHMQSMIAECLSEGHVRALRGK